MEWIIFSSVVCILCIGVAVVEVRGCARRRKAQEQERVDARVVAIQRSGKRRGLRVVA